MPAVKFSPLFNDQTFVPGTNAPASGYKLFVYAAGSSTKLATYTDSTGTVPQSNPIVLNSAGQPANPIWLAAGLSYKLILASPTDTDPPSSPLKTFDNITGVNDASSSNSQWLSSGVVPTFVSSTSFTVPGDQTSEFHARRRAQFLVASGTVYGTIQSSSFGAPNTTVTMSMDAGSALDSGLTSVNLSIIRADKDALPAVGPYGCLGLIGNVNASSPLSKFDISADAVTLRNLGGSAVNLYGTGTKTCDLGLAGPIANGRDQSAAFSANSWIYLYFIWNGATLATLASTTAPASFTGSTLPTGYTHWCFATAIRWNGSSNIVPVIARGRSCLYDLAASGANRAIGAGTATTMTAVSLSSLVPPNALRANLGFLVALTHTAANVEFSALVRPTGSTITGFLACSVISQIAGVQVFSLNTFEMAPGTGQSIDYRLTAAPGTNGGQNIDVIGYVIPNGDA